MEIMSLCNLADALRESTDAWGDFFRYYGGTAFSGLASGREHSGIGWRRPFFYVPLLSSGVAFVPLPLFLMIGPILSQRLNLPWSWRVAIPALGLVLFLILPADAWFRLSSSHRIRSEFTIVERDRALGVLLNRTFAANERPSLGVVAAGAIALAYEGEVIDMMGLNNSIMAHAAGDRKGRKNHAAFNKDILLQQSPEIIAAGEISSPETFATDHKKQMAYLEHHPSEDVLKGLRNEDRFLKTYELGFIEVDRGKLVGGWFLKSYIPKLRGLRYRPVAH